MHRKWNLQVTVIESEQLFIKTVSNPVESIPQPPLNALEVIGESAGVAAKNQKRSDNEAIIHHLNLISERGHVRQTIWPTPTTKPTGKFLFHRYRRRRWTKNGHLFRGGGYRKTSPTRLVINGLQCVNVSDWGDGSEMGQKFTWGWNKR